MSEKRWIWQCKHVLPSETGAGQHVVQEVLQRLQQNRWIEHDIFGIHLAMEEALMNAIKHGNQFDASKQVQVSCQMSPDLLRIEITDEGEGFDPSKVPDPTDPANIESPSGRGIMLMRNFMTRVEFNDVGNHVVMEKERENSEDEGDDDDQ